MQRKFVTNLALVLALTIITKPFWLFGIDRVVQNHVGTVQYGYYYTLLGFSFLFNILCDLGITSFNLKNIAQNNHLLSKHFASIVLLRIMLAGVFTIVTIIVGIIWGYSWIKMQMLLPLILNQILISFIFYLRSNLAGLHLFKIDSIISVLDRTIMIAICGFLLLTGAFDDPAGIRWFIYAQTFAYAITALITFVIVIDKAKVKRLAWRWPFFMMILKQSYPYAILVLLMTFYNRIDAVMLERMLDNGAEQSGIYASAYRLLDAANMVPVMFAGLLMPIFARMIKLRQSVEEMVRLVFSLLVVPGIIIAAISFFYRYDIMKLLYDHHIEESAKVFGIIMCCFVPIASVYIFGTLLTANGSMKQLNIMASSGMAINIILNIILIPKYQAIGAAFVSLTTQFLTALAQIFMAQHLFRFKINYKLLSSFALFVVVTIVINYYISSIDASWLMRLCLSIAASAGVAFLLKLISIRNLVYIIKYGE